MTTPITTATLVDERDRLRTYLDFLPLIVWTADASGWIDWYNPHWYVYTGQTPEEAAGWGWQAAHHPDDFPRVMEAWPESIRTGRAFEMAFRLKRADGAFRWFLTRVEPIFDDAGNVVRWFGTNTDIEAQKQAEQRSVRVASLLHEALLPAALPILDGARLDSLYLPAGSDALVGGDWYDALLLRDGRLLVSCGDVTGHGLDAAAAAFRVRQAIAFAGREHADPASVLTRVNRVMVTEGASLATAAVAVIDREALTMEIALAGHPPPIVARPDEFAFVLQPDGVPLGVDDSFTVETRTIALAPDALILFYTDGITEFARDVPSAEQTLELAATTLVANPEIATPADFVKDFVLDGAEPRDDVAILIVHLTSTHAPQPAPAVPLARTWRFHSSHAQSAHTARVEVGRYLEALSHDAQGVADAELVIGEILANTVEHAPGLVEVGIDWSGERPKLTILDSGRGTGPLRKPMLPDLLSEDGRGLFLMHALADDVVFTTMPTIGTQVTCCLRITRDRSMTTVR